MKTGFLLFAAAVLAVVCDAKLAEKVSEDDDFVVYRIPVRALDLQSQATGHFEGYELNPSYGRSNSKSSSHSKSTSSSTGSGRGKGYGQGGSSEGHGTGYGGSSSGHGHGSGGHGSGYGGGSSGQGSGYGGGSSGQGSGYGGGSSGHGSGYGGSGSGYGGSGSGYGGSGSGYGGSGSGQGGSGSGYGGHHRGYRQRARSGYYTSNYDGFPSDFMSSHFKFGGGHSSYTPSYDSHNSHGSHSSHGSHAPHYDDDEGDHGKVITTTKTVTTNSAHDTGVDKLNNYRQTSDSLGDIRFRLGDFLKDAPGHESIKYNQKLFQAAAAEFAPGYRSGGQAFNVNEFTRNLNHGFNAPAYRNNRFNPQASFLIPRAYALRHAGFGIPTF